MANPSWMVGGNSAPASDWFTANAPTNSAPTAGTAPGPSAPAASTPSWLLSGTQTSTAAPGSVISIDNLPQSQMGNVSGLQNALEQGLTGEAAVNWANQNTPGGGYAFYPDKNVYATPGGQGYIGANGSGGYFYAAGDSSGGGADQQAQTPTFTPPPAFTGTFSAPTQADLAADTSYQTQLARGQAAIQTSAASRGTVLDPGTLKDLSDWTTGTASQEYNNLYARNLAQYQQSYQQYLNTYGQAANTFSLNNSAYDTAAQLYLQGQNQNFNQNYSLAALGLQGANAVTGAGANYATGGSNAITGGANAVAAGQVGSANAINQGIGNITNAGISLYGLSQYGQPSTSTGYPSTGYPGYTIPYGTGAQPGLYGTGVPA